MAKKTLVLKFGGTSVGTPENIKKIHDIVANRKGTVAVVVSAFGGLTDQLIGAATLASQGDESYVEILEKLKARHLDAIENLIKGKTKKRVVERVTLQISRLEKVLYGVFLTKELTLKSKDFVLSFGERLSANIVCESFISAGVSTDYLNAGRIIKTDNTFGDAVVNYPKTNKLVKAYFKSNKNLQIVTGFISSTDDNETTTLGRGGSDLTASIIAAAIDAAELQIWTDVDGMMTADPRKVADAFTIKEMTYAEAMELSHFGAKVVFPATILPVMKKNLPIWVKNTFNPDGRGTLIGNIATQNRFVKGISSIDDVSIISINGIGIANLRGFLSKVFGALASRDIPITLISQASPENLITLTVSTKDAKSAKDAIEEGLREEIASGLIDKVILESNLSIVTVVGENMRNIPGVSGNLFASMGKNGINVRAIAQGSSERNISAVIQSKHLIKALNVIHENFFLSPSITVNLYLVGVGTIGKTLLEQIRLQNAFLEKNHGISINLIGVANSRKMVLNADGIDLDKWDAKLKASKTKTDMDVFVEKMKEFNIRNSIFIDCTANADVPKWYHQILDASISIVAANKVACSSAYEIYDDLKKIAAKRGVRFLYETNVGAALPIIQTMNDLVKSGDKIIKIEAILSGTLNFVFNTLSKDYKMHDVVKEAQEMGYSEPDPRIDLTGVDVSRKILILCRELGLKMELKDIEISNFLPKEAVKAKTLNDFWKVLKKYDNHFEDERLKTEKKGKRQKYFAQYSKGKAKIGLGEFGPEHPFYNIAGSDNIVLFTTERYKAQPLIIQGAGAGAEVTAAGVFAEIIKIANL
ncbi:MAG: bifunctional aspartate kinase/homoserine dehydrogenase I [Flavobacteriales bacterium]|nr:bifunctional aspartate kinase/homoserine dehydrogenase I [Flavobacteriales bacterium]